MDKRYKKIIQVAQDSDKIDRIILIDLLTDFLKYNSWIKVERKWVNSYWFSKYYRKEKINKLWQEIEKVLNKKQRKKFFQKIILLITGFSNIENDEVFSHMFLNKSRKFLPELKEEMKKEEREKTYTYIYRNQWSRILADCDLIRISKKEYLPDDVRKELKEWANIVDEDDEILKHYQNIIKSYENDLARDYFDDQDKLSELYKQNVIRIAFKTRELQDLLYLLQTKESWNLEYNSQSWSLIFNWEIIHTFKERKDEKWEIVKNYKKLFTAEMYKNETDVRVKYSVLLFEMGKQTSIIDDLSNDEISFIQWVKDKINIDVNKKTNGTIKVLFSQEKDWNKRYIYRNH